jgi:hypothetical protein
MGSNLRIDRLRGAKPLQNRRFRERKQLSQTVARPKTLAEGWGNCGGLEPHRNTGIAWRGLVGNPTTRGGGYIPCLRFLGHLDGSNVLAVADPLPVTHPCGMWSMLNVLASVGWSPFQHVFLCGHRRGPWSLPWHAPTLTSSRPVFCSGSTGTALPRCLVPTAPGFGRGRQPWLPRLAFFRRGAGHG